MSIARCIECDSRFDTDLHPDELCPACIEGDPIMTEAQRIAESAGFTFPTAISGIPYQPSAPDLAGFGDFALYARCCIDEALLKEPHASSTYRRYGDPLTSLVNDICDCEQQGHRLLLSYKALALSSLIDDIEEAAKRDPDAMRQKRFMALVHRYIATGFIDAAADMRRRRHFADALRAHDHAEHHNGKALTFTDAMGRVNRPQIQAAE